MKVLLTGSNGQLGKAIIDSKPKGIELIKTNRGNLDLANKEECLENIEIHRPDWIINSGAFTNVDMAEENIEEVFKINSLAPRYFSESIRNNKGKLLQISTDYVFDGKKTKALKPYDKRNPINIYGHSKAMGEDNISAILGGTNKAIILRSSWVMGPNSKNFLSKILNLLLTKKEVKVVSDQFSCPTSTETLSQICWMIINKEKIIFDLNTKRLPIMHCSDGGLASWYEVAKAIAEIGMDLGLITDEVNVYPIKTSEYTKSAKRPSFSLLDCESSFNVLNFKAKNWKVALYETMTKIVT